MKRRLWLFAAIPLVLLLGTVGSLIYFIAWTPDGLQAAIGRLPRKIGPVEMQIGRVDGTLVRGFSIARFELWHERVHLVVTDLRARLSPVPLLWQTIRAPKVEIGDALIEVQPRKTRTKKPPRFLPGFLRIRADDAIIRSATLVAPNGQRLQFRSVRAAGLVRARVIRIYRADLDWEAMKVTANATLRASDPTRLRGNVRTEWMAPEGTTWIANSSAEGDLDDLELKTVFAAPFRATFEGAALTLTNRWRIVGAADIEALDLRAFGAGDALGEIAGRMDIELDSDGIRARGALDPQGLAAGPFDLQFEGRYAERTLHLREVTVHNRTGGTRADIKGGIEIVEGGGPQLDLAGRWTNFRWPLRGEQTPALRSNAGEFTLRGELPYAITASGDVLLPDLQPIQMRLASSLGGDRLVAQSLDLQAYGGTAALRAEVAWKPEETWLVSGRVKRVDTGLIRKDLPGSVGFDITASGRGFAPQADLDVRIAALAGTLRGNALRGGGHVIRKRNELMLEGVDVRVGTARVRADGQLAGTRRNIRFDIEADDLSILEASARGKVKARGTIAGTFAEPVANFNASMVDMNYAGVEAESLNAKVDIDGRPGAAVEVSVGARNVTLRDRRLQKLDMTIDGTTTAHKVDLSGTASPVTFRMRGDGAFAAGDWTIRLAALDLDETSDVNLRLEAPAALTLSASSVQLERACLRDELVRLCMSGLLDPERWQIAASSTGLPIRSLTAGMLQDGGLDGTVSAELTASAEGDQPFIGSLRAELADAKASRKMPGGRIEVTALGGGLITAEATPAALTFDAALDADGAGSLKANARAMRTTKLWKQWPLTGEMQVSTNSLGFVAVIVDPIDRSSGKLDANLTLAGTLGVPLIAGKLTLRDGRFDIYQVNMALRDTTLDAAFSDNTLALSGSANIGDGSGKVDGKFAWRGGLPYGDLRLKGENLRVANVPEARIEASPDIALEIDGRRIHVTGEVQLPYARLDPADVTNAVFASSDEVIVSDKPVDPEKQFIVTTEIKLVLGDRVTIDTLGLSGRLTGSVVGRTGTDDVARGQGELNVAEGKYTAFGRRLDIERGRLIFNNGPIGDPTIDIRASREFPDIKAGANVRGTLRAPTLTLFSVPSIPQSQILSLLIAGGSLETATAGAQGGNPLAVQGGAILAQQLGGKIGLEDIGLESNLANDTSLVLGKYLSPRLYVSYGISLTEAINTFKMRYTLSDKWTVKLEAGEQQSTDLEYVIEK